MDEVQREFAEFYAAAWDDCLRIVMLSVGNRALGEDLDTATTAEMLGMSGSTVATHLHRAIAALRRDIPALTDQEPAP